MKQKKNEINEDKIKFLAPKKIKTKEKFEATKKIL